MVSCYPGGNNPRHDLPRVEIGQIWMDSSAFQYIVLNKRWVRTGTFGAGYDEYYVMRLNPIADRTNEMWIREKTIQETAIIINESLW